ncbi:MAG: hypothetical protein J6Y89_08700 [Lachnospiraceae bacterium]|nr:hypothetical protein [Lachnospiraceae bacterium]
MAIDQLRNKQTITDYLNNPQNTREYGMTVCRELGLGFNCLGSFPRLMADLNDGLKNAGKKYLQQLVCCIAFSLAQMYSVSKKNNNLKYFDDRIRASAEFSYDNLEFFLLRFESLAGFVPVVTDADMYYYPRAIDYRQWIDRLDLLGFLDRWSDEHSTNKQAIFGGYVRGVYETDPEIGEKAYAACFPYI